MTPTTTAVDAAPFDGPGPARVSCHENYPITIRLGFEESIAARRNRMRPIPRGALVTARDVTFVEGDGELGVGHGLGGEVAAEWILEVLLRADTENR